MCSSDLADPQVDLVYIATPHSHHYLHAKMCLEAGKNVLCEKAFTVNADQARKLFALAKEKNLLITEAIWTRYMPSRKMIDDIISSGVIGEVTAVTANLNYAISEVERIRKPELAGGALLDVGVYTINFASMVLGDSYFSEYVLLIYNRYRLTSTFLCIPIFYRAYVMFQISQISYIPLFCRQGERTISADLQR